MFVTIILKNDKEFTMEIPQEEYDRFVADRKLFHSHPSSTPRAAVYKTATGFTEVVFADVVRFEAITDAEMQKRRDTKIVW